MHVDFLVHIWVSQITVVFLYMYLSSRKKTPQMKPTNKN